MHSASNIVGGGEGLGHCASTHTCTVTLVFTCFWQGSVMKNKEEDPGLVAADEKQVNMFLITYLYIFTNLESGCVSMWM